MPSSTERKKGKSKEDTWTAPELTSELRDGNAGKDKPSRDRTKHRDSKGQERKSTEKRDPDKQSSQNKTKEGRDDSKDRKRREDKNRDERPKDRDRRETHGKDGSRDRERRKDRDSERGSGNKDDRRREEGAEKRDNGHRRERKRTEEEKEGRWDNENGVREGHREKSAKERVVRETEEERRRRKKREKREKEKQLEGEVGKNKSLDNKHDEKRRQKDRDSERRHREIDERQSKNKGKGPSEREHKRHESEESQEERRKRKEEKRRLKREEEERNMQEQEVAKKESSVDVLEPEGDAEANGYDYDDDFEDYDDDFEGDDGDGEDDEDNETAAERITLTGPSVDSLTVAELRQAMEAENRLTPNGPQDAVTRLTTTSKDSSQGAKKTFINFTAAKQRQISNTVAERTRRRGEVLMKLIELDTVTYDLFDMPPVRDYDRFIQYYGRSDTMQAAVQCNDDNLDRDIQTDEIDHQDRWCQHPAEGTHCSGGDGVDEESEITVNQEAHSLRLTQFLESAGQVMAALLEENRSEVDGGSLYRNQTNLVFSEGYTRLHTDMPSIKDCAIVDIEVHPVQTHLILAAYGRNRSVDDAALPQRATLCVWNVNDPSQPQKILTCRSQPSCCLWSPSKANMAFAGTEDGSILVWDLREPSSLHSGHTLDSRHARVPTFSTDAIMRDESHTSRVVSMLPIVTAQDSLRASLSDNQSVGSDVTFQLATLEEKGVINFWVVLEIAKTSQAGSESELSVIPGGRVKLVWSSSVCLNVPKSDLNLPADFRALCFKLDPEVPSQFYVGTDQGVVLHASRHGAAVYPKVYRDKFVVPVGVAHLDFSPFGLSCFLVGCSDGSVRLHSRVYELPLLSWPSTTMGAGIASLAWSQSRPSIFFSADIDSRVFVWSLLERDGSPIKEEKLPGGRLTALIASHDYLASSIGRPGRHPELVIANSEGSIEVHRLNEHFTNASGDELDSMAALLESST